MQGLFGVICTIYPKKFGKQEIYLKLKAVKNFEFDGMAQYCC